MSSPSRRLQCAGVVGTNRRSPDVQLAKPQETTHVRACRSIFRGDRLGQSSVPFDTQWRGRPAARAFWVISGSEQSHKGSPPPGVVGPVPSRRCSILSRQSRHPSAKVGDGHERRRRVPHVLSPALRPGLPPKSLERLPLMVVKMIMLPCPDDSNASRSGAASRIVQDARRISSG